MEPFSSDVVPHDGHGMLHRLLVAVDHTAAAVLRVNGRCFEKRIDILNFEKSSRCARLSLVRRD